MKSLLVVGAGPAGLAAALSASDRGFDVTVLEGEDVGHALTSWGRTRFFSPLRMNLPARALRLLGGALPGDDALLTGIEMVEGVLRPLAQSPPLAGRVRTRHRVMAIGRAGLSRSDFPGHPLRSERRFRVLAETPDGERVFEADIVLDASGVALPNPVGRGGIPAPGEKSLGYGVLRDLGALDRSLESLAGRRVLLVGHGHSAANAILRLAEIGARDDSSRVIWAVRSRNRRPCVEIAGDPLPERRRVSAAANDLAEDPPPFLAVLRRAAVEAIEPAGEGARVSLTAGRVAEVDRVVSLTGYRPDWSFLSELPIEISPVTEGAGRLSRALANVTDCLSPPHVAPRDLESGEPRFYAIGSKSYGRSRAFLLRSGFAQTETILDSLN